MGIVKFTEFVKRMEEFKAQYYQNIVTAAETDFNNLVLQARHRRTIEPVGFPVR